MGRLGLRRRTLAAVTGLGLLAAGCATDPTGTPTPTTAGSPSSAAPPTSASPSASSRPSARRSARPTPSGSSCGDLSLPDAVGQLFVMGVTATGPTSSQLKLVGELRVGSVIMMGNTSASVDSVRQLTDGVRAAGAQPDGVRVMVTVDQEGGQVRRLRGSGFSAMPSALTQATWSDAELTSRATRWGQELRRAGVDLDLAPVADVVPTSVGDRNRPIGALDRGYGSDPKVVGAKVTAVVTGLHAGKVGVAVKHFPGLGRVTGNTDFAAKVVDSVTTRDDPLLGGFTAGEAAGADMIMVSTAYYTKIDAAEPAAFSKTVITGMLRTDRDFDGVVVSDDLGVAEAVTGVAPGDRAIRFIDAGGDLAINVDPSTTDDMVDAVLTKAKAEPAFAARVRQSSERVLKVKARYGLATCR